MGSKSRHTAAPMKAPITMPGPKIPPDPPEPMESPVATMRAKGTMSTIHSGIPSSSGPSDFWIQPYPVPSTSGMAIPIAPTISPPMAGLTHLGRRGTAAEICAMP